MILDRAMNQSLILQGLESHMNKINKMIKTVLKRTKTVYRGMQISELASIAKMKGAVGYQSRIMYAARNDFVSCSIDADIATLFATKRKKRGLVVEMDILEMNPSDYCPVTYVTRRIIYVTPRGRHTYNPYERFGGSQSGWYMRECEVQIKKGARLRINSMTVSRDGTSAFKKRLEKIVKIIEKRQNLEITIKYVGGQL